MTTLTKPETNSITEVQSSGGLCPNHSVPCYRLKGRLECIHDRIEVLKRLRGTADVIVDASNLTIEIAFVTDWEIVEEVVEDLKSCGLDLHIFVESLKFVEDFDGVRDGLFQD
ncbi:hypothetical protein N9997_01555 [Synechococcus sp. AH-603-L18]|nr:hypothetical protein [Synechococcus sp. AH-603-L18]MDB4338009.1 hypothetical protein [Synechococcus sp. AH-603-L18]